MAEVLAAAAAPAVQGPARPASGATAEAQNVRVKVLIITPQMAEAWLKERAQNRSISASTVDAYAEDMIRGNWRLSNNGIGFDADGRLIDGQHRLEAVRKAGRPVAFIVVENLPPMAIECIDIGRPRSVASILEISHGTERASYKVAIVKQLDRILKRSVQRLSPPQVIERMRPYEQAIEWAIRTIPRGSVAYPSCITAALIFAYETNPKKVDSFTQKIVAGEGLVAGSPPYLFREYLIANRGIATHSEAGRQQTFLKTLYCLRAYIKGEPVRRIYANEDALNFFRPPVA